MTSPAQTDNAVASGVSGVEDVSKDGAPGPKKAVGLSPSQLMWRRFKRDRTGVVSACVVIFFFVIALLAPVISMVYGKDPYTLYGQDNIELLDEFSIPTGVFGGVSGDHWFGIEPNLGRDVFMQLLYGMRTSIYTALAATILMVVVGVVIGLMGGYFGGKIDYWLGRVTDLLLGFPSQLFFIASMPVVVSAFVRPDEETPTYLRATAIIIVLSFLGWMGLSRLIRAATLSLREREFIEAAKIAGASPWRIIRKELLPNLVTPILVQGTLLLPSTILSVAFLSFVGVGFVEPTPDWGRMFAIGADIYEQDPAYMFFPGVAMVVFVVAFNLLGDSVRDAFDPKTGR
ncbi:ABC transporter permease [Streptomyces sp. NBC_01142]|uniref:ABC transporter permease n=1 Tax=Streptomyces sp. NBC_01142 TaxID=2975865 RepID=UPI0022520B0F|nr:ABC transporter permease [Streptomyces sp. NBC_01142]MCX4819157.1 ABC transporter permease [Streptomyces sp. NBC_01142]